MPVFADRAERIAETGLTRGGLPEARALFSGIASPDARDEFAYGLVLLRHFKRAEAVEHLEKCRGDASFLPGWEAALRVLADERKYDVILEDLPSIAAAVSELVDVEQARAFAERLGKLVAAVELASDSPDGEAAWLATLENLRPSLQKAFDVGYEEVASTGAEIATRGKERHELAMQKARDREAAEKARIKTILKDSSKEQTDLAKTAGDWTKLLTTRRLAAEAKLEEHAAELEEIVGRQQLRTVQIHQLRRLLEQLQRSSLASDQRDGNFRQQDQRLRVGNGNSNHGTDTRNAAIRSVEVDIATRMLDLEDDEFRRQLVLGDVNTVRQGYLSLLNQARQTVGAAGERFEELSLTSKALTKRLEKLAQNDGGKQKAGPAANLKKGWSPKYSVRALFPWDYEAERERLSASDHSSLVN